MDVVMMLGRFLWCMTFSLLVTMTPVQAAESPARLLAERLLLLAGTAAVFDSPEVQAALSSPQPFLEEGAAARIAGLLARAGLRPWQPPRVWLLQGRPHEQGIRWENMAPVLDVAARARGLVLSPVAPLPSANEAIGYLTPGQSHPGLTGLLAAYEADVLVLLRNDEWTLWGLDTVQTGKLPAGRQDVLPDVLAEVLAAAQQWPMARGRSLVPVHGVAGLADFAGVQAALQALPGARQVQLLRASPGRLVFALSAPAGEDLQAVLAHEPRLPAAPGAASGLPARVAEARLLAGTLPSRTWQADAPAPVLP